MDNPKVEVRQTKLGYGLFAKAAIAKDEIVAEFDGQIYEAEKASDLPADVADHAVQFAHSRWRDSRGFARRINHSCEPNTGFKGLFTLVAMRDIAENEELYLDYEMSENSDWRMQCLCGSQTCRKIIGTYNNMPSEVRKRYGEYISEWLIGIQS